MRCHRLVMSVSAVSAVLLVMTVLTTLSRNVAKRGPGGIAGVPPRCRNFPDVAECAESQ